MTTTKTYKVIINEIKPFSFSEFNKLIEEISSIENYWKQIGGICDPTDYSCILYGTNEILIEFILSYPLSPHLTIKEK